MASRSWGFREGDFAEGCHCEAFAFFCLEDALHSGRQRLHDAAASVHLQEESVEDLAEFFLAHVPALQFGFDRLAGDGRHQVVEQVFGSHVPRIRDVVDQAQHGLESGGNLAPRLAQDFFRAHDEFRFVTIED